MAVPRRDGVSFPNKFDVNEYVGKTRGQEIVNYSRIH